MQIITTGTLVGRTFLKVHDGRCKQIHFVLAVLQRESRGVKRSGGIRPVEMTNQTLIAEEHFLPANLEKNCRRFRFSKFGVSLPDVHRVFERRRVGLGVLPEGLRILALELETHPIGRAHAHVDPHATENIGIFCVRLESSTIESFEAHSVFAAEAQPCGECLIDVAQHRLSSRCSRRGRWSHGRGGLR